MAVKDWQQYLSMAGRLDLLLLISGLRGERFQCSSLASSLISARLNLFLFGMLKGLKALSQYEEHASTLIIGISASSWSGLWTFGRKWASSKQIFYTRLQLLWLFKKSWTRLVFLRSSKLQFGHSIRNWTLLLAFIQNQMDK